MKGRSYIYRDQWMVEIARRMKGTTWNGPRKSKERWGEKGREMGSEHEWEVICCGRALGMQKDMVWVCNKCGRWGKCLQRMCEVSGIGCTGWTKYRWGVRKELAEYCEEAFVSKKGEHGAE